MPARRLLVAVLFCCLLAVQAVPARAARRVALVVGNANYAASPLRNPVNDAKDMAKTLRGLGFEVILRTDADKAAMLDATEDFFRKLGGAEAGLFYFSGHGMQVRGMNYLLPVGVRVHREADVEYEAVPAGRVMAAMEDAGAKVNIVILDACRDNPFKASFRSASRGLAVVRSLTGSFVSYATAPGNVAADGSGRNGVFTKHLLQHIGDRGLTIEQVFKRVTAGVYNETGQHQLPWVSSSLMGDFYFAGPPSGGASPAAPAQVAMVSPRAEPPTATGPQPGAVWVESATGMEFVWVPGGCFQMGSDDGDDDEKPVHRVCLDGLWTGKYEVTRGQFRKFVQATGYRTEAERGDGAYVVDKSTGWKREKKQGYDWERTGFAQDDRHPVVNVSWNDAQAFVDWLGRQGNGRFRLLSEAEWEYAARAGSSSTWFWGNDPDTGCRYANGTDKTDFPGDPGRKWTHRFNCSDGYWGTAPVGTYKPNAFGLHDMLGNVFEWVEDTYHDSYAGAPTDGSAWVGKGPKYVMRGSAWDISVTKMRCAARDWSTSGYRYSGQGFRLAKSR